MMSNLLVGAGIGFVLVALWMAWPPLAIAALGLLCVLIGVGIDPKPQDAKSKENP